MKFKELKNLTLAELTTELEKLRAERAALHMKVRLNQAKTFHKLSQYRKDIARIQTLLGSTKQSPQI